MKKIATICVAALVAAISFTSCEENPSSVTLTNENDSLSYAFGMSMTQTPRGHIVNQIHEGMGLDTAYIDEFIKGFYESATIKEDPKKLAHNLGIMFGIQMNQQIDQFNKFYFDEDTTKTVNSNYVYAGFMAGVSKKYDIMEFDTAKTFFDGKLQQKEMEYNQKQQAKYEEMIRKMQEEEAAKKAQQEAENGAEATEEKEEVKE